MIDGNEETMEQFYARREKEKLNPPPCPSFAAKDARIRELEEEARQVCGALGEFYGKGQGTAVEKINFMRKDHQSRLADAEELTHLRAEVEFHKGQFNLATIKWGECAARLALYAKVAEEVIADHAAKIKQAWEANRGLGHPCECPICAALAALKAVEK